MHIKIKNGFSLIELMVVIAIVAILAAVAVPTYKNYIISTRLNSTIPVIKHIMTKSMDYWNRKGTFPIAYDLGYPTTSDSTAVTSPSSLSPYFSSLTIRNQPATPSSAACNGVMSIAGNYNLTNLGISSSYADSGGFTCYLFNMSGKIISSCSYFFASGSTYRTDNFIPQWYGCQESTCTSPRPYYQQKDGSGSNPGFTSSNCN